VRADDEAGAAGFGGAGVPHSEVYRGGYFEETGAVNQAEGLQDFRRQNEGHLIIADDRPILVMSFGLKYQGANPGKYKTEGRYDIPVGYKAIIKWDEDEIVFMTREGTFGPEFQIIYLPKSPVAEDFTLFEWNSNIADIWDQFLTLVEGTEDRDIRFFDPGPWRTFGVTRDEVQIALKQGTDVKTAVDRILYCADEKAGPSVEEYMRYLGLEPETDVDFSWICKLFKDEPKPAHFFEYISEGMVYWFSAQTQETYWKHPLYDKYKRMLQVARIQKPLPHWKSIMSFRIEFLLNQVFRNNLDEEQDRMPLVETVDNVIEMARIFRVNIQNEPYLVHVLRRALRHYAHAVREKRKVKDVEDFRNLIVRYHDLVAQFEQAKDLEMRKVQQMKVCVQCDERDAVLFCDNCRDFFCQACFDRLHARGRRKTHRRTWVEMGMCAECSEAIALFHCVQCADLYCRDCFQDWHMRGGRRNHIPIVLRSFNSQTDKLADATPAMGTGAGKIVKQARSPWFCFLDENNIKFYYNIETGVSRRDMPIAVINEPIEENKGGGLAGGWAGTWGSNMYPDPLDAKEVPEGQFTIETAF